MLARQEGHAVLARRQTGIFFKIPVELGQRMETRRESHFPNTERTLGEAVFYLLDPYPRRVFCERHSGGVSKYLAEIIGVQWHAASDLGHREPLFTFL